MQTLHSHVLGRKHHATTRGDIESAARGDAFTSSRLARRIASLDGSECRSPAASMSGGKGNASATFWM
eukprot:7635535-Pyramimonas_sp.AAC.2